jgi:hypothetical protein
MEQVMERLARRIEAVPNNFADPAQVYVFGIRNVLVRQIDGVLDLDWLHRELLPFYSHTCRPSIDPCLRRCAPQ